MFSEIVKQDTPLSQMNALPAPGGYHAKVNPLSPHSKVHWTTSLPFHCGGTPLWLLLVTRVITICKSESRKSEQIYPGSGLLRQLICLWQLSAAQATARRTLKMRRQHIDRQHKTNVQGRDKKPKDKTENRKTENWTETKRTAAHKEVRSHKKKYVEKFWGLFGRVKNFGEQLPSSLFRQDSQETAARTTRITRKIFIVSSAWLRTRVNCQRHLIMN